MENQGYGEPVAYEGALKIKEMCYLHAEGYSGGALKHGPFALIEDEKGNFGATPIILLIFDDVEGTPKYDIMRLIICRGRAYIKNALLHPLA